jgi:hypothetical protein
VQEKRLTQKKAQFVRQMFANGCTKSVQKMTGAPPFIHNAFVVKAGEKQIKLEAQTNNTNGGCGGTSFRVRPVCKQ